MIFPLESPLSGCHRRPGHLAGCWTHRSAPYGAGKCCASPTISSCLYTYMNTYIIIYIQYVCVRCFYLYYIYTVCMYKQPGTDIFADELPKNDGIISKHHCFHCDNKVCDFPAFPVSHQDQNYDPQGSYCWTLSLVSDLLGAPKDLIPMSSYDSVNENLGCIPPKLSYPHIHD